MPRSDLLQVMRKSSAKRKSAAAASRAGDDESARGRLLSAATHLFCKDGINATGIDATPAMLERAREAVPAAHWHEIPATGPDPVPATVDGPAVVTVFRLLLNVSDEVRHRALAFAARVLPDADAGLLVVENHGNAASLRHFRAGRRAGDPWFAELSQRKVADLLAAHGFTIVARYGCGLLPRTAYRRPWLRPVARRLDDLLCRLDWFSRFATDVLYVARRDKG